MSRCDRVVDAAPLGVGGPRWMATCMVLFITWFGGCAAPNAASPRQTSTPLDVRSDGEPARRLRAGSRIWSYEVTAGPDAAVLRVTATLPPGVPAWLGVDRFAHPYVVDLVLRGEHPRRIDARGERWYVPECSERGCQLEYRYDLARAATDIDRFGFAGYRGGALLAPPSTWLIHPKNYRGSDTYRFHVTTAPGESFVSGVFTRSGGDGSNFEAPAEVLFEAPYSAFGRFRHETLHVAGGTLRVSMGLGGKLPKGAALLPWLDRAARNVAEYYGRFPLKQAAILIVPTAGSGIAGMQLGNGGASILLFVGESVTREALADDWVAVHEMFHLGFPTLERRYLWFAEGLASYQEPIARARAGIITEPELWRTFLHGMPLGLPRAGDAGLDGGSSWGRVYWGGALFCMLADVGLRSTTKNRLSLDVAARAIQRAGGDTSQRWTLERTLWAADRALGTRTFRELHAQHGAAAVDVDLPELWRRLGVREDAGGRISFDESAEWAHVRRAIARSRAPELEPESSLDRPRLARPAELAQGQSGFALPGVPKSPL